MYVVISDRIHDKCLKLVPDLPASSSSVEDSSSGGVELYNEDKIEDCQQIYKDDLIKKNHHFPQETIEYG